MRAADNGIERIVVVHKLVAAHLVGQVPGVDIGGESLFGGHFGPVVLVEQVEDSGFQLLGLADVGVRDVGELIVADAKGIRQAEFGDQFGVPQQQAVVGRFQKLIYVQSLQVGRNAGDGGLGRR